MATKQTDNATTPGITLGIDVQQSDAVVVAIAADGQVVDMRQLWRPADPQALAQACQVLAGRWSEPVLGLAVACADPENWQALAQLFAPAGPQLAALGRGTARALAEHRFGALRGCPDALCVTIGQTLTAGVVRNGQPLLPGGSDPELAHLPIVSGGPLCVCGKRGCLQTVATEGAWQRRAADAGLVDPVAAGQQQPQTNDLGDRAARGDPVTIAVLAEPLDQLARGVAILATAAGVQDIALQWPGNGGNERLHRQVTARIRSYWPNGRTIAPGQTGPLGSAWGAALWAQQALRNRHIS